MGPRVRDLQQRFDGPVPAPLLTAARALDDVEARARRENRPRSAGKPGKVTLKPEGVAALMASQMLEIRASKGCVLMSDLELMGWTAAELVQHGTRAREIAAARAGLREAIGQEG